jgi:hypothetical protein
VFGEVKIRRRRKMDDAVFYTVVMKKDGVLLSYILSHDEWLRRGGLCLTYQPGVPITGEYGPIFVFDTLENACLFVERPAGLFGAEIWSCKAEGAIKSHRILDPGGANFNKLTVSLWWEDNPAGGSLGGIEAPLGTYVAPTITLLEKVWPDDREENEETSQIVQN